MKKLTPYDEVCASRMAVYRRLPYFMKMLFKLVPVAAPIPTLAVDDRLRLLYNEELAAALGAEGLAPFLAHEVQHPLRRHFERGNAWIDSNRLRYEAAKDRLAMIHPLLGVDAPTFFNVMGDLEINPVVVESGFTFPFEVFFPKKFGLKDGDFAEEYAEALLRRAEALPPPPGSAQRPAPGDGDGAGKRVCEGCCGSAGGNAHPAESGLDPETTPVGSSASEVDIARRQVAHDALEPSPAMKDLMERYGAGRGVHPSMSRWATDELAPPEVPWQRVLAPFVRDAVATVRGRTHWKIGRPSRRREVLKQSMGEGAPILPSLVGSVPRVGIMIDSSGSMFATGKSKKKGGTSLTVFEEALSEVWGIVKTAGIPVWGSAIDTEMKDWTLLRNRADLSKLCVGGGGTDMRVGIAAVDARNDLDVVVLLTDAETPWPTPDEMPRRVTLITCVVGDCAIPAHIKPSVRVKSNTKREAA